MPAVESGAGVSVVVCAYTEARAPRLLDALRSLRGQSQPPLEVIVVVDHNPVLLDWIREEAPDVVATENRGPRGLAGARNSGLRTSRGQIVAFLDDDAVASARWIECLSGAYRDPRILGVGGAVLPEWEGQRPRWLPEEFQWVVGCSYRGLPPHRSPVRNLIGCNMSFRREVFAQVGGFTTQLGRVAGRPLGCEETELCIRIHRHAPDRQLLYDPAVIVHHRVPQTRATWAYFLARCHAEGVSKAEVARLSGRRDGLSSERAYASRTLPAGLWGQLRAACLRGDAASLARAAAIVAGLAATVAGYLSGRLSPGSTAQANSGSSCAAPL